MTKHICDALYYVTLLNLEIPDPPTQFAVDDLSVTESEESGSNASNW